MRIEFEFVEPISGFNSYPTLVVWSWETKMNENISLNNDRIKIKGKGKNIIIPLGPSEGKPWDEQDDEDVEIFQI